MKNVALIYGGEGCERDISRLSARGLYELIDKKKYRVIPVFISKEGNWYITEADPFGPIPTLAARPTFPVRLHGKSGLLSGSGIIKIDCAVPILHGDFGEDGIIQGALSASHIPFVFADTLEGAVCADKIYTKLIARGLGIPTADFVGSDESGSEGVLSALGAVKERLGFPVFIKPCRLGSSIGASRADTEGELYSAYIKARHLSRRVLIERLIDVEYELECALVSFGGDVKIASGIIRTNGAFYDYEEKYHRRGAETEVCGERNEAITTAERYAKELYSAIGINSTARIDFLVDRRGDVYFNEINTIPGMTEASLYPALTEKMGLRQGEFIERLIESAINDGNI